MSSLIKEWFKERGKGRKRKKCNDPNCNHRSEERTRVLSNGTKVTTTHFPKCAFLTHEEKLAIEKQIQAEQNTQTC